MYACIYIYSDVYTYIVNVANQPFPSKWYWIATPTFLHCTNRTFQCHYHGFACTVLCRTSQRLIFYDIYWAKHIQGYIRLSKNKAALTDKHATLRLLFFFQKWWINKMKLIKVKFFSFGYHLYIFMVKSSLRISLSSYTKYFKREIYFFICVIPTRPSVICTQINSRFFANNIHWHQGPTWYSAPMLTSRKRSRKQGKAGKSAWLPGATFTNMV